MSEQEWKAKYEREHELRCDLERRFDTRVAGVDVVRKAEKAIGKISDPQQQHDARVAVGAVILWAQAMVTFVPVEQRVPGVQS